MILPLEVLRKDDCEQVLYTSGLWLPDRLILRVCCVKNGNFKIRALADLRNRQVYIITTHDCILLVYAGLKIMVSARNVEEHILSNAAL